MKIALVRKDYDPSLGGAERYVSGLSRALAKQGDEIHVFAREHEMMVPGRSGDPVIYHPLKTPGWPSARKNVGFAREVSKALAGWKFDLVIGLSPFVPQDVYRVGDGVFAHWQNIDATGFLKKLLWTTLPRYKTMLDLEREIYLRGEFRQLIVESELVKSHVQRYYKIDDKRIKLVRKGVDSDAFGPKTRKRFRDKLRASMKFADDTFAVLFVGHNFRRKGLIELARAFSIVSAKGAGSVKLLVLGHGRAKDKSIVAGEAKRGGWQKNLVFLEQTDKPQVWFSAADAFCLPSHYDPCSNATLEALASSVPVITTKTNGASEYYVDRESGLTLPDNWTPEDIAELVLSIASDRKFSARVGEAGRAKIEPLTWELHAEQLLKMTSRRKSTLMCEENQRK
ncbi:MAG: glycosyltransferase family 4 protein [Planctomycetes bacterium]|nr:glycosyltransferase family 4 protein [Planctomycetota bacterium]